MLLFKKKKPKHRPATMPPRPKNVPTTQQTPPVPKTNPPKREPPPKPKVKEEAPAKRVDYEKEFLNVFKRLTYRHRAYDVWRDFVVMLACSISNAIDKRYFDQREEMYLKLINRYDKTEQSLFPELAAYTVLALESNCEQDFLGEMYMRLRLGNDANGQFFTPYHVCQLMADIAEEDVVAQVKKDGYVSINDPCCGAGATLIAGVNSARRKLEKEA